MIVVSRTGFGQDRLRSATVGWLQSSFPGRIEIGDLGSETSLLGTMTLRDVSIVDPSGRPFVAVDRARLSYDWRTLVTGRVVLDDVDLEGVQLVIERLPDWDDWNFIRAFRSGPSDPADTARTHVDLYDVSVRDAVVEVRVPWEGGDPDSARVLVEPSPSGLLRVFSFQDLRLEASRILAETPAEPGRLLDIDAFSADVYVWDQPAAVRAARGTVAVRDSLVMVDLVGVELPDSRATIAGKVVIGDDGPLPDLRIRGDRFALADLGWLHPSLPPRGEGRGDIDIRTLSPVRTLGFARDLDVQTPDTRVRGSVALVTGDTLYFSRLALEADPFDLPTLERLLPVDLPLDGLRASTLRVRDGR